MNLCLAILFMSIIEIVPSGIQDADHLSRVLEERGIAAKVVITPCDALGAGIKKDRSLWGRVLKKCLLDFPKKVHLHPETTKVVFMNIPNHLSRDYHVARLPKEKLVLFMWEPYIRLRKMYDPKLHTHFSRIYTWDDDLVDNKLYFKFYLPVWQPMIAAIPPFEEKKLCVMVAACASDKYPKKYPNELYSERKKAADFFEAVGEEGFDLFGKGWDVAKNKSYRGPVADKIGVIKNYRFSICYENCQGVKGYVTEKIFDCFQAGNVPIYWGASNIEDYIPKACFIDRRDFASYEELYTFIKNMTKEAYEGYLQHIRDFLQSDAAKLFSSETYDKIFFEAATSI
jgi:hypothetical protein